MRSKAPGQELAVLRPSARGDRLLLSRASFENLTASGTLTRLSTAWSRDGAAQGLRAGPHARGRRRAVGLAAGRRAFYVCGDAKRMAKDVETALIGSPSRMATRARAAQRIHCRVEGCGRYQADVIDGGSSHTQRGRPPPCGEGLGVGEARRHCSATPPVPPHKGEGTLKESSPPLHHVPLLRRRLWRAGDGGWGWGRGDRRRCAASGQFRPAVLQGRGARRDAGAGRAAAPSRCIGSRAWAGTRRSTRSTAGLRAYHRIMHGPEAVAFYLSGQLLTEDYYVANKLAKGFIGTPHVDTNSRLCMASSVAGHRRAFGADVVPQCYDDLELADLVVLVGSNAAWCHPVLYQRIQVARAERGARVVNIDPRRTATSEGADLHLSIRPGTDAQLWNGLLVWLGEHGALDWDYVAATPRASRRRSRGARAMQPTSRRWRARPASTAADIETFYRWWTEHAARRQLLLAGRQPVGAGHRQGQRHHQLPPGDGAHRQARLRPAVADRPAQRHGWTRGRRPRQHAGRAHGLSEAERDLVRRFWGAPNLAARRGPEGRADVRGHRRGDIKALWVMGTNPAVSLPRADHVRAALRRARAAGGVGQCCLQRHASTCAHVRLPAAAWGEKDGTVTNSERRISRQRAFLPLPGEARPDWWMMAEVARAWAGPRRSPIASAADIFREHASPVGLREPRRAVVRHFGAVTASPTKPMTRLAPTQWPVLARGASPAAAPSGCSASGTFAFPSGRGALRRRGPGRLANATGAACPFLLNTGRVRDQWHTMTRTGVEPAARRARRRAVRGGASRPMPRPRLAAGACSPASRPRTGQAVLRVMLSEGQQPGSRVRADPLVGREQLRRRASARWCSPMADPFSGQPEAKATPARVTAIAGRHAMGSSCRGGGARYRRLRLLGPRAYAGGLRDVLRARRGARELERMVPDVAARRRAA